MNPGIAVLLIDMAVGSNAVMVGLTVNAIAHMVKYIRKKQLEALELQKVTLFARHRGWHEWKDHRLLELARERTVHFIVLFITTCIIVPITLAILWKINYFVLTTLLL